MNNGLTRKKGQSVFSCKQFAFLEHYRKPNERGAERGK